MGRINPEIHAVVEVASPSEAGWFQMPPKAWPRFIRLSAATDSNEIALFVAVAAGYSREADGVAQSPQELAANFPTILPGGLAIMSNERKVLPGCCCGLESWSDWRKILTEAQSPWTGHDPAPLIETVGDEVHVWSDGGMGDKPVGEAPIVFSRTAFGAALTRVEQDLVEFLKPLGSWLADRGSPYAREIVSRFEQLFVRLNQPTA